MKPIVKIVIPFLVCISVVLSGCSKVEKSQVDTNMSQITPEYSTNDFSNSYIYLDENYNLIVKNKISRSKFTLEDNVESFMSSDKFIAFTCKENSQTSLRVYSIQDKTETVVDVIGRGDFILFEDRIYYVKNSALMKYVTETSSTEKVMDLHSNDVVIDDVSNTHISISSLKDRVSTTTVIDLLTLNQYDVLENSYNVHFLDGFLYSLNSSGFIQRTSKDGITDTIESSPIVKFKMLSNYIVYLDEQGHLNSLDLSGTNRVLSQAVTDFEVHENKIYYLSSTKSNMVYEVGLDGLYKIEIGDTIHNSLKINVIR